VLKGKHNDMELKYSYTFMNKTEKSFVVYYKKLR
jgi:hypothetical protein